MWVKVRLVLVALSAVQGFAIPFLTKGEFETLGRMELGVIGAGMLLGLLIMPPAFLAVIGIQAVNHMSAPVWTRPNWSSNFLNLRDPLHFFHFGAWCIMAAGPGMILMAPFTHWLYAAWGALVIAGCAEMLWVVRLCARVYRRKYQEVPGASPGV